MWKCSRRGSVWLFGIAFLAKRHGVAKRGHKDGRGF